MRIPDKFRLKKNCLLFQTYAFPSDLDSTAGSEWEGDSNAGGGGSQQQLGAVTKEQLFSMLQKSRARYHKYKGRYSDLTTAYRDLEAENKKVKEVMQQTQVRTTYIPGQSQNWRRGHNG